MLNNRSRRKCDIQSQRHIVFWGYAVLWLNENRVAGKENVKRKKIFSSSPLYKSYPPLVLVWSLYWQLLLHGVCDFSMYKYYHYHSPRCNCHGWLGLRKERKKATFCILSFQQYIPVLPFSFFLPIIVSDITPSDPRVRSCYKFLSFIWFILNEIFWWAHFQFHCSVCGICCLPVCEISPLCLSSKPSSRLSSLDRAFLQT